MHIGWRIPLKLSKQIKTISYAEKHFEGKYVFSEKIRVQFSFSKMICESS